MALKSLSGDSPQTQLSQQSGTENHPSLVPRLKFPAKGSHWLSLNQMPFPGPGCGIHSGRIDTMAASIPTAWLEVQKAICPRSWRGRGCLDPIEQELPTYLPTYLAQPPHRAHQPAFPFLSCLQICKGCPMTTGSNPRCYITWFHLRFPVSSPSPRNSALQPTRSHPARVVPAPVRGEVNKMNPGLN